MDEYKYKHEHEFITTYFYIPNSKDILPNYNLYDIFSLITNLKSKYSNYSINVQDKLKGNKMFTYLIFKSDDKLLEQQQRDIQKDIDYFTGEERLFVILFPFDKKLFSSKGIEISSLIYNQLLQIVDLTYQVKRDDAELLRLLDDSEIDFDSFEESTMFITYKFEDQGLFTNISKTGYFEVLYDQLFRNIYNQIIIMFEQGYCFCNELFARRFNLIPYKSAYYQDWKLYFLFKNINMTEFLFQLQEDGSAFFNLRLDDIDRHHIAKYLNELKITYKFCDSGIWINDIPNYEFIFELAQLIFKSRIILNCQIELKLEPSPGCIEVKTLKDTIYSIENCQ